MRKTEKIAIHIRKAKRVRQTRYSRRSPLARVFTISMSVHEPVLESVSVLVHVSMHICIRIISDVSKDVGFEF